MNAVANDTSIDPGIEERIVAALLEKGRLKDTDLARARRLQEEATSLREVLTDIRMTHAMGLLQSSDMPVSAIAASAGFESQSRFAIRFRSRFGFPPTAVRGRRQPGQHLAAE